TPTTPRTSTEFQTPKRAPSPKGADAVLKAVSSPWTFSTFLALDNAKREAEKDAKERTSPIKKHKSRSPKAKAPKSPEPPSPKQAPTPKGTEVAKTVAAGFWNFNMFLNLDKAKAQAEKEARERKSPIPEPKPYTLMPGGHRETATLVKDPNNDDVLGRLLLARDYAGIHGTSRNGRYFNLHHPVPKPAETNDEEICPEAEEPEEDVFFEAQESVALPQLPDLETMDGFVPLSQLLEKAMESPIADGKGNPPETSGAPADNDSGYELLHRSPNNSSSSSSRSWADSEDPDFADDGIEMGGGRSRPHQGDATAGLGIQSNAGDSPVVQGNTTNYQYPIPSPPLPPLRPGGKYHFSTQGALRRLEYMASYLDFTDWDSSGRPLEMFLRLISYEFPVYNAGRRNPAFLRAGLEIDWTGIWDEVADSDPPEALWAIRRWRHEKGRLFTGFDKRGMPTVLKERNYHKKMTWPALVAAEDLYMKGREKNGLRNGLVFKRVVLEEGGGSALHRRVWERPGKSRLGEVVTGPEP
ncbi:hypothetical protein GE09DRAFT_1139621, partial [Coniochaeta sp. 2T2.1]